MNDLFENGLGFRLPVDLEEAVTVLMWQVAKRDDVINQKNELIVSLYHMVKERDLMLQALFKEDNSGGK